MNTHQQPAWQGQPDHAAGCTHSLTSPTMSILPHVGHGGGWVLIQSLHGQIVSWRVFQPEHYLWAMDPVACALEAAQRMAHEARGEILPSMGTSRSD